MKAFVFDNYLDKFKKINNYLNLDVIEFEVIKFNNGEGKIIIKDSVKDEDVIIFSDFSSPSYYHYLDEIRRYSKDEYYIELRRLISALDSPKSINLVLPLIYACRQNANNERESKDYDIFIKDLVNLGVDKIISFETHGKDERVIDISLSSLFVNKECDVVVSPDKGGVNRAREYSKVLNSELYNFEKKRDLKTLVKGSNPICEYNLGNYDFKNKNVLVVDDILDSGSTLVNAINSVNSAKSVDIFVAYPLFSSGVKEFEKLYLNGKLNKLYVSDLIYLNEEIKKYNFIEILDCGKLISNKLKEVIK